MKPMSGTPLICNEANFNLFSYQQSTLYSKGKNTSIYQHFPCFMTMLQWKQTKMKGTQR